MKYVVFALIAGIAGYLAWAFFQGACRDGRIFVSENECIAVHGAQTCRLAFAESRRKATEDYAPFNTLDACQRSFPRCEPHRAVVSGFVPVATGSCVQEVAGRFSGSPVYDRIGRKF